MFKLLNFKYLSLYYYKKMKYIALTTTNTGYQRYNESYSGETLEDFKKRLQINPEWRYGRFFEAIEV